MSILGRLFGRKENKLKEVIDDYSEELNLMSEADKLESDLDALIKREIIVSNKELAIHLSSVVKSMMNKKSISEKLSILRDVKKALSETPQKDNFNHLLYKLEQNYEKQKEKISHANDGLKLCPSV